MQVCLAHEQYLRWLTLSRDLSPHTTRAYDGDIAAFTRHLGTHARVDRIDRSTLIAFLESQRAAGLASTTIKRRASAVRGFCNWLSSRGHLASNPWVGVAVVLGRSRKLPRLVTTSDLGHLLASLREAAGVEGSCVMPERPHESTTLLAVALMVVTGVRVNEAVEIRCRDIDLGARTLRIVGKGHRERHVYLTNDWITGLMHSYLSIRNALGVEHQHLFFNRRCSPLTAPAMRSRLLKVSEEARIDARVTPHMLRHTAATQLIEAGVNIRLIQQLLGHASLSTTEIYTHVSDPALRKALSEADVLGRILQP